MGSSMQTTKYQWVRQFIMICALFMLLFSGYSHAVVNSSLPNKNDIQNKLNTLNKKAIRVLKINWLLQILKSRWVFMMS